MKKYIFLVLLTLNGIALSAQTYNNEWIDYSKSYYKFSVGTTGLYRISQSTLSNVGIASVPAEQFQLWKNGVEVPIYTSIASGVFSSTDYLEFYGEINDGTTDTKLYKYDSLQMSTKNSLYTDTAAYFLTVNSTSLNKRIVNKSNDVVNNLLPPEPYFNYTIGKYFKDKMNIGYGKDLGEVVCSASYETAEGWSSNDIPAGGKLSDNIANLRLYPTGPQAKLETVIAGNANTSRSISTAIGGNQIATTAIDDHNISRVTTSSIPLSYFSNDSARIEFSSTSSFTQDVSVVSHYLLTYPRQFNFNGASQFNFSIAGDASGVGKYIEITNFNYGTTSILYDLTNNIRYLAVISSGVVKFALPSSTGLRKFVLLNSDSSQILNVNNLVARNFIDYSLVANQGDYLIISHPLLFNDGTGNDNVEKYRLYRSSIEGGGYNAKTIDINQIIDQFNFGVKHHPLAIRNFSAYTLANFSIKPKYLFLIGKGLNYNAFKSHESLTSVSKLALVPTWGFPSSDNLITASRTGEYPLIPIGRLSAINGTEVLTYLNKVKEYELVQKTAPQTIAGKAWMKNIAEVTGGLVDAGLSALITSYMAGYQRIATDTLFGGKVYQFSANTGLSRAVGSNKTLSDLLTDGLSLITYFGHSSPNTIEFNLDNPESYNNTGKYPLLMINGCESGDLFEFDTSRAYSSGTLSEKFVFANHKGSIGYVACTGFGLPAELNYFTTEFYTNFANKMYGNSIGNILQTTMKNMITTYSTDYISQTHVEEMLFHGDPAIVLNPQVKPDYVLQDSLLKLDPVFVSVADDKVTITTTIANIGKAIKDSVGILIQHTLPNNTIETLFNGKIKAISFQDSITITLPINPIDDKGLNQITVTIDPNNLIDELSESNNTVTKSFTITDQDIRPVYPYEYAIVNKQGIALMASTANPTAPSKTYIMEMDTTALFNSSFKITRSNTTTGGIVQFMPNITFQDSVVYYWRVTEAPINNNSNWRTSSFVYIHAAPDDGFNQSHYFQYKNNSYLNIHIDSTSRKFMFDNTLSKISAKVGVYGFYDWDQNSVNKDDIQVDYWGCNMNSIQFYVFDSASLTPWKNVPLDATHGQYGSYWPCSYVGYRDFFEYSLSQQSYRKNAMNFFDSIPKGSLVVVRSLISSWASNIFIDSWKSDTTAFGSGKSLWHQFQKNGLTKIDSFTKVLPFLFVFKKGDSINVPIYQEIGPTVSSLIAKSYFIPNKQVKGNITSPWFGPALQWKTFKWDEFADSTSTTTKSFDIIGDDGTGQDIVLATVTNAKDTDISFIDADFYPYLKLRMNNVDFQQAKTTQLKYWMLTAIKEPEGAIYTYNGNYKFQDTVAINDTLHFQVGFKNISDVPFDSLRVRLTITDQLGVKHQYNNLAGGYRIKPLVGSDSVIVTYNIPVANYFGSNEFYLDINPDNNQIEQYHFNNVLYKSLFVTIAPACPSGGTSFYTGKYNANNTYQWQVNTGTGYVNLANGGIYSGVNRDTLQISNAASSMYGYKYRAIITNGTSVSNSYEFCLKFGMTWTGAIDDAWENAGNWSCNKIPDINTDVTINAGVPNYPVIKSSAVCRSINIKSSAKIQINTGFSLQVAGPPNH